jgi:hypothetical protein
MLDDGSDLIGVSVLTVALVSSESELGFVLSSLLVFELTLLAFNRSCFAFNLTINRIVKTKTVSTIVADLHLKFTL